MPSDYGRAIPIRVGDVPDDRAKLNRTNVSFRLTSKIATIEPAASVDRERTRSSPVRNARPLLVAIQFGQPGLLRLVRLCRRADAWTCCTSSIASFRNYGIAIIMLTVLVRSLMFPLSRRQALVRRRCRSCSPKSSASRKSTRGNMEARTKAQQELFRKHNYNPLGGCLLVFLQLPIFLGLYRSLAVDVELRRHR